VAGALPVVAGHRGPVHGAAGSATTDPVAGPTAVLIITPLMVVIVTMFNDLHAGLGGTRGARPSLPLGR